MCYAKPGPRCSHHSKKLLNNLYHKREKAIKDNKHKVVESLDKKIAEEEKAYMLTPAFISELRNKGLSDLADTYQKARDRKIEEYTYGDRLLKPLTLSPSKNSMELSPMTDYSPESLQYIQDVYEGNIPEDLPASVKKSSFDSRNSSGRVLSMSEKFSSITEPISLHQDLMKHGYYAKVTKRFARGIKNAVGSDAVVLDVFAGRGFLVKALREQGIKTIGSDNFTWENVGNNGIEKAEAIKSLRTHGDHITHVVLSWDVGAGTDYELLQVVKNEYPHVHMINIGEEEGCTNSSEFWEELNTSSNGEYSDYVEHYFDFNYDTTYGLYDDVRYYSVL